MKHIFRRKANIFTSKRKQKQNFVSKRKSCILQQLFQPYLTFFRFNLPVFCKLRVGLIAVFASVFKKPNKDEHMSLINIYYTVLYCTYIAPRLDEYRKRQRDQSTLIYTILYCTLYSTHIQPKVQMRIERGREISLMSSLLEH